MRSESLRPRKVIEITTLIGIATLALGFSGCSKGGGSPQDKASREVPRNVRTLAVSRIDLNEYLTISGSAGPIRGTDLAAEESGRVGLIALDRGSAVRKGEPIVVLDRRLLEAEMRSAEASRDLNAYDTDRMRQLFDANSISQLEMLEAETRLQQSEATADAARIRHERAATLAPYDGIVADRLVEIGQLVMPGVPVARIVDPYTLKIEGAVTEKEITSLSAGMKASVQFDGVRDPVPGTVHWVGFEADPTTGKFGVEIRVDNRKLELRPGVIARARVLKASHKDVIAIPRDAIVPRSTGPTVYVVEGEVARQRQIALGADQGMMVIVTQGLSPGDLLVVRGQREIHDGSRVQVREQATDPDGSTAADPAEVTQEGTVPTGYRTTRDSSGEGK